MLLELQTVFPGLANIMDSVYKGGQVGWGWGAWVVRVSGEPKAGSSTSL